MATEKALAIKESFLRQKSRCLWLKEGDMNSKFFHTSLNTRSKRNSIKCIKDNGVRLEDCKNIEVHISELYSKLFNQSVAHDVEWDLLDKIPKLKEIDVQFLCKWVTTEEIEKVILGSNPDKTLGPDGFNGKFFKENRELVKNEIDKVVFSTFPQGSY